MPNIFLSTRNTCQSPSSVFKEAKSMRQESALILNGRPRTSSGPPVPLSSRFVNITDFVLNAQLHFMRALSILRGRNEWAP